jgi:MYXO-CTERM domain-containing protein
MRPTLLAAALPLLLASTASAADPVEISALAALEVSRFSSTTAGFSELTEGPAAVRDGDPTTAWLVPGAEGERSSITFDWSSAASDAPYQLVRLRVDMLPADAALTVESGADLGTLSKAAAGITADAKGADLTFTDEARPRVIRLSFPAGTAVAGIAVFGTAPAAKPDALHGSCDQDGVHLTVEGKALFGLVATRDLAGGGTLRLPRRAGATLDDATVRFDPRPMTYTYSLTAQGTDDPPLTTTVSCEGEALQRPAPGPIHGVIEGFYGRPWTWAEREKVIMAMGALGLDTYIYAPKDDPKHREHWRDDYDGTTLGRFDRIARVGKGVGVNVVWAISPGLDIDPSSAADVGTLIGKVASLSTAAGMRDAALLMDDISATHDAALGQAHAALAQKLLASMKERDPAARLWFVPSVYAGLAGTLTPGDHDYLAALSGLPAEVPLAWTGEGVFSALIDIGGATNFGGVAGKSAANVWIWDNYPVNDVAIFRRLYTHPITGRESLLPGSGGLMSNPMRQALASIPAIASYAELALDPPGYAQARAEKKPLATAQLARTLADGPGSPQGLEDFFAELVHHDSLWPDEYASPGLSAAISAYQGAPSAGATRRAAALDLATRLGRLAVAEVDLRRELDDQALSDEIDAHARATALTAEVVLESMGGTRAELLGDSAEALAARSRGACLWLAANQPSWRTIQDAIVKLVPTGDPSRCVDGDDPFVGPTPVPALVGKEWTVPFPDPQKEKGAAFSLVGPAGASIDAQGTLHFTPPRLGHFRLVAIRSGDAGATAKLFDLLAVETFPPPSPNAPGKGCSCNTAPVDEPVAGLGAAFLLAALALRRRATRWTRSHRARPRRRAPGC